MDIEELSSEKVKVLIVNNKLEINSHNFLKLKKYFHDLRLLLIGQSKVELNEDVKAILDTEDVKEVVSSENFSLAFKESVIKSKDEHFIFSDTELINSLALLLSKEEMVELQDSIVKGVIIKSRLSSAVRIKVFIKNQNKFELPDVDAFLRSLPEPFSVIPEKGKMPKIDNTGDNLKLAEILREKNYISSFKITLMSNKIQIATYKN